MNKSSIFLSLLSTIFLFSCLANNKPSTTEEEPTVMEKEFTGISIIDIATVSGNCTVKKHDLNTVIIKVELDYKPAENVEPVFTQEGNKLELREKMTGQNSGWSEWTLTVPDHMEIKFGSASGSFKAENIIGEFNSGTASGNVNLKDVTLTGHSGFGTASGHIKLENVVNLDTVGFGTASGDVIAKNMKIGAKADYSTASGDVLVSLTNTPGFDVKASSASGDAEIDFNGNPIRGSLEMKARVNKGDINCPFDFDKEEVVDDGNQKYNKKSKSFGAQSPVIRIHTASGKAALRK